MEKDVLWDITIEINRGIAQRYWGEAEPFARQILEGEKRCCVCDRSDVPLHLTIEGGEIMGGLFIVGLLHCHDHSERYTAQDYRLVNGLLLFRKSIESPASYVKIGAWFNVPWEDFGRTVASASSHDPFVVGQQLKSQVMHGYGNFCLKSLDFPRQEVMTWWRKWGIQLCPFCRADNKKDYLYCVKCGRKLDGAKEDK